MVLLKTDRFGQWFQRRSEVQSPVRPVLIVMGLIRAQDPPQMALIPDQGAAGKLASASPVQHPAIAFTQGARTLHSTARRSSAPPCTRPGCSRSSG
jgi:hypothetical protein